MDLSVEQAAELVALRTWARDEGSPRALWGLHRADAEVIHVALAQADVQEWALRRMLQALDAYWLYCDGLPDGRITRGQYGLEDWWLRFEKYRALACAARR